MVQLEKRPWCIHKLSSIAQTVIEAKDQKKAKEKINKRKRRDARRTWREVRMARRRKGKRGSMLSAAGSHERNSRVVLAIDINFAILRTISEKEAATVRLRTRRGREGFLLSFISSLEVSFRLRLD